MVEESQVLENEGVWFPMPRQTLRNYVVKKSFQNEFHGKKMLEMGYGSGHFLRYFAEQGAEVWGYDPSEMAFRYTSTYLEHTKINKNQIHLCKRMEDLHGLQFDVLVAIEVLEHIENDSELLVKWADYLNENGEILISVPAHMRKWGNTDIAAGHVRRYEREELITKLEFAGYKIKHLWCYGFPLSLLLDSMSHRSKNKELQEHTNYSRGRLTAISGISRKQNSLIRLLSSKPFMFPFCKAQMLFLNYDFGSGYIVIAGKR
jgi:SAM-dependent methyltransferase